MNLNYLNSLFVLYFGISFCLNAASAFKENEKFCIRTDPILVSELEDSSEVRLDANQRCDVTAVTLTAKEKDGFKKTMCHDIHSSSHKKDYFYLKVRNGDLEGSESFQKLCKGESSPLLAWIPLKQVQPHLATQLNATDHFLLIGKAYDSVSEKSQLCHFQNYDLANNISDSIFSCVLMLFEDNFFTVSDNINVLVELRPLMYEIRNITYLPWVNVSTSYKTLLGKSSLQNPSRQAMKVFGSINYAYVEKVQLKGASVYQENEAKLPLLFDHRGSTIELDKHGIGGLSLKEEAYFGRIMDPRSNVTVDIIGQWAEHKKRLNADLFEYLGSGLRRFSRKLSHVDVSFIRIDSTEPVFEMIESSNSAKSTIHKVPVSQFKTFEQLVDSNSGEWSESATSGPADDHPYPNFYPWFVAACFIVGATIIAALIGVVRTCSKDEEPKRYQIANKI